MLAKSDVEQLQIKLVTVALNRLFGDFRLMALLPKQKSRKQSASIKSKSPIMNYPRVICCNCSRACANSGDGLACNRGSITPRSAGSMTTSANN